MSAAAIAEPREVEAEITYLAPGSFINRRYVAPGVEVNTGTYEPYRVRIRDGRPIAGTFSLDRHGFTLAKHMSAVRDFKDNAGIEAVYAAEVVALIKRLTGADEVLGLGWMVRTSGALPKQKVVNYQHKGGVQPPAGEAHVDFTPRCAEARARDLWAKSFPGAAPYRRFIASSVWRTFSAPPQDTPLALCEGGSVRDEDGAQNTLVVVDQIPSREEMLKPIPGEEDAVAATIFRHNPAHRWWYFSNMTRDEAIMLKFYDSDHSVAWRAPHTAFRDPSFPDARVRESIEVRSLAFFR
ncbi:MAG: hypothetical protein JNJ73_06570 [Hyphomonadaceae bacterium]|nr:hypothetical protein [Hyphomonadaceae bacterium]